jgi:uncharacterized protein (TIGR00369 family)
MATEASAPRGAGGFSELIGVEYLDAPEGEARGRIAVDDDLRQPYGLVHGGVLSALAESICSRATGLAVRNDGMAAFGQANDTSFLRPIESGHVNAHARARHRGTTSWVWDVDLTDDDGRLCALSRMTVAVRPGAER